MGENADLLRLDDEGDTILCILRRRRGQHSLRLSVRTDGRVLLSVPYRLSLKDAKAFASEKKEWIKAALARQAERRQAKTQPTGGADYERKKAAARKTILERIKVLNAPYGFRYAAISIRNQQSRWGSCSSSGRLSFNYRLVYLPPELIDYVIVHELCHLGEMNHSSRFWTLVARNIPDYDRRRRDLRVKGKELF